MASGRAAPARLPLPAALMALLLTPVCRAEPQWTPALDLRETYSDNANLAPPDQARGQWVSEAAPSLSLIDNTPRLRLSAAYQAHFYAYSDRSVAGTQGAQSEFQGAAHADAIEGLLYVDAAGSYGQQAISAFGPPVGDDSYTSTNRAHVKTYRLSPYLVHGFGSLLTTELHYTHDVVSSDQIGFARSQADSVLASLNSGRAFGKFGWGLQYSRQVLDNSAQPRSTSTNASLNLRYALSSQFSLTASGGYDRYAYDEVAGSLPAGKSWSAGFVWTPSTRTSVSASYGKRYFGNSDAFNALHRSRHTVWTASYSTDVTTARDQFLLPAAVSTADLLDRLFAASISDPGQRQQAVQAFIQANKLPATLVDSINYFSNSYQLQKQFQLSTALNSAYTSTILSLYDMRRQALSSVQTDSQLLGNNNANVNEATRQQGVSAAFNLRLSARSSVNASATYGKSSSLAQVFSTTTRAYRISLARQFAAKLNADIELRRQEGSAGGTAAGYRENALAFHVNQRF